MHRVTRAAFRANPNKIQRAKVHGPSAGATAHSKGSFGDKEKAVENVWARQTEAEQIKALRSVLNEQRKATQEIKKELDELAKKKHLI